MFSQSCRATKQPSPPAALLSSLPACHAPQQAATSAQRPRTRTRHAARFAQRVARRPRALRTTGSVYNAYMHAIKHAKQSIYIENQFFTSAFSSAPTEGGDGGASSTGHSHKIKNRIVEALYERLCAAIDGGEDFTVVVVLPEVPEGGITSPATQSVLHFQRLTISRKPGSLLKRLEARFGGAEVDLERYISFFSLRTAQPHPVFSGVYSEQARACCLCGDTPSPPDDPPKAAS